jgi:hypothetical protein
LPALASAAPIRSTAPKQPGGSGYRINACTRSFSSCIELGVVRVRRLGYGCRK